MFLQWCILVFNLCSREVLFLQQSIIVFDPCSREAFFRKHSCSQSSFQWSICILLDHLCSREALYWSILVQDLCSREAANSGPAPIYCRTVSLNLISTKKNNWLLNSCQLLDLINAFMSSNYMKAWWKHFFPIDYYFNYMTTYTSIDICFHTRWMVDSDVSQIS